MDFFFFQISEENSYLLSENLPSARISVQLSTNQNFLGPASVGYVSDGETGVLSFLLSFIIITISGKKFSDIVQITC